MSEMEEFDVRIMGRGKIVEVEVNGHLFEMDGEELDDELEEDEIEYFAVQKYKKIRSQVPVDVDFKSEELTEARLEGVKESGFELREKDIHMIFYHEGTDVYLVFRYVDKEEAKVEMAKHLLNRVDNGIELLGIYEGQEAIYVTETVYVEG